VFDVAMMRAQLAGGIIQDKQQQDLDDGDVLTQRDVIDSGVEVTHGLGFGLERPMTIIKFRRSSRRILP
jgi:hypothetical protein